MSEGINNPHDKRLKELFSNKKSFISLLKDCVKESWVDDIDWDNLRKSSNSFILQDFSEKEADIVYEATIAGEEIVFYILLELQSDVDYRMPYRLLLYMVEILRYYYNHADVKERERKDFKFPVIFPLVFFSGSAEWTVPQDIKEMFSKPERFGKYALGFEYMLLDAKGYDEKDLKQFSSRLLAVILLLEKAKNDIEFYNTIRHSLDDIKDFDDEERRIFNLCIKIMDLAYGFNRADEIKKLLDEKRVKEVDIMLCDVIENAKYEKENLIAQGKLEGGLIKSLEIAKEMLLKNLPFELVLDVTKLSREQIESIELD